jgi:glycosyltransferase involved in cell wall biosynthesis
MRILYVAAGMQIPGAHGGSVHALQLARGLARAGHEVHLACLRGDPVEGDLDGVELHPLPRRSSIEQLELLRSGAVRALAARLRPDVVLERFYTFGGTGLRAAAALGIPAVLEVNSPARPYPGSLRDRLDALTLVRPVDRWRRWQLAQARAYVATSPLLLPERLRDRTTTIVNGVDVNRIRPGDPGSDDSPLRCIYVSSFRAWHGAEDLVEAAGRAVEAGASLRITCIGEGPRLEAAREAARTGPARDAVRFLGRVPHAAVPGELAAADVGLAPFSPARHRALELGWFWSPIKIFEYLAAGLMVVTADIPELRELLDDSVARFYPPDQPAELADRLMALDRDRAAVRAAGVRARALACERYTWDHQARRVAEVLERAVIA